MKARSTVLLKLAEMYEESASGRHGEGRVDFQPAIEEVLKAAGCGEGEARELAERDLRAAREAGVIGLTPIHRRDPNHFSKVRLAPENEEAFFAYAGLVSPSARRAEWVALFREAAAWPIVERFRAEWKAFCERRAEAAKNWRGMKPFDSRDIHRGRKTIMLLTSLMAWEGRQLIRWASSILCGHSKYLEEHPGLQALLAEATAGRAPTYESLGILPVPAGVTFHGPLRLRIGEEWHDFRDLRGQMILSGADVERITAYECEARRCLTVENGTPFRSLAALRSGELLIHTSYANDATLALLRGLKALPSPPEFWHFGDTDPSGFHILADLRLRSGIAFRAFRMSYRASDQAAKLSERERALIIGLIDKMPEEREALEAMLASGMKGDFEQESLRPPTHAAWPFYAGMDLAPSKDRNQELPPDPQ
jgi:hypothetical protein